MRNNEHIKLSDILKDFVESNKLEKGLNNVNVQDAWYSLMGNGVANYTISVQLKGTVLHVALHSSVLREELSYGKEKIIAMLNEHLGNELITKLVLR